MPFIVKTDRDLAPTFHRLKGMGVKVNPLWEYVMIIFRPLNTENR
jgi:hypothetical protein